MGLVKVRNAPSCFARVRWPTLRIVARFGDDLQTRLDPLQLPERLQAVFLWHQDVRNNQVVYSLTASRDTRLAICGFLYLLARASQRRP